MSEKVFVYPVGASTYKYPVPDDKYSQVLSTFLEFVEIYKLDERHAIDFLVLLTTCRNQWFWLNALHAEIRLWLFGKQGGARSSIRHAISSLMSLRNRKSSDKQALSRAVSNLRTVNQYVTQYKYKRELFLKRFPGLNEVLLAKIKDTLGLRANVLLRKYTSDIGDPLYVYSNELNEEAKLWLAVLDEIFEAQQAFTGLMWTFITNKVRHGELWHRGISEYYLEFESICNSMHVNLPSIDPALVDNHQIVGSREDVCNEIVKFAEFCSESLDSILCYSRIRLPSQPRPEMISGRALMWILPSLIGSKQSISIGNTAYRVERNKAILIFDINNSAPVESNPTEIKQDIENYWNSIDEPLDESAKQYGSISRFTWDDSRLLVFNEVEGAIKCAMRIAKWLNSPKYIHERGVTGLRFGLSMGDVICGYPGWREDSEVNKVYGDHPVLGNMIARSARLMNVWAVGKKDNSSDEFLRCYPRNFGLFMSREACERIDRSKYEVSETMRIGVKSFEHLEMNYIHLIG